MVKGSRVCVVLRSLFLKRPRIGPTPPLSFPFGKTVDVFIRKSPHPYPKVVV